jgi:hypothetical protein
MDERIKGQILASLEKQFGKKHPAIRPQLTLVVDAPEEPPPCLLDYATRRMHERMIWQFIVNYPGWGFRGIYSQAIRGRSCLAKLADWEVIELREKMHSALECLSEGIDLREAGLIRYNMDG